MWKPIRIAVLTVFILLLAVPAAIAQETTTPLPTALSISTDFVGIAAKPGDTVSLPVDVAAPPGSRVRVEMVGLPDGWSGRIQGGGFVVDEVLVGSTGHVDLTLNIDVPEEATEDTYDFTLEAMEQGHTERLGLSVRIANEAAGYVSMSTDFPSLRGDSGSSFSYTVNLANATPQDVEFALGADAPAGWSVEVQPTGETKASTVTVAAGKSTTLTVNVNPPDDAEAGVYTIVPRADGGSESASVELSVEITGSFDLSLDTANGVLSASVVSGTATPINLVITNTGTAPLQGVNLFDTSPSSWDVTFDPSQIDLLQPNQSANVTAMITPSDAAINGDYVVSLTASTPDARDSIDIRTTVETSSVWGIVGIGVIVLALIGLSTVFRIYGRR